MPQLRYRYFRRRLNDIGLVPTTMVGNLTLFLLVFVLLLYVGRAFAMSLGFTGQPFVGWITLVSVLLAIFGTISAWRWIRDRFMWRLRNRLLVTYVFIGVVPILLVLLTAVTSAYLLGGQFATFLAASDMESELNSLAAANAAVASELALRLESAGRSSPSQPLRGVARLGQRYANAEVDAWRGGRPLALQAGEHEHRISYPGWLKQDFAGISAESGKLYLRAGAVVPPQKPGAEELIVVSSLPLDRPMLDRIAAGIGAITVYGTAAVQLSDSEGNFVVVDNKDAPDRKDADPDLEKLPSVSGGTLPPPANRLDKRVQFMRPFSFNEWKTGRQFQLLVVVQTRPSILYSRLFVRVGSWANVVLGVLAGISIFFGIIVLVAIAVGLGLMRTITRSVANLYMATRHIERGDFRHRIQVRSRDQLAALETSFNSMAASLERLLAEQKEKERMQSELEIAHEVQAQLFPGQVSLVGTVELHGICKPARTVSGDYYDFLQVGPGRLTIAVGDISGKGISAALLMATLHSAVRVYEFGRVAARADLAVVGAGASISPESRRATIRESNTPGEVLSLLNSHLYHSTPPEKYATLFLGVVDGASRTITYSNAGHLPPLVVSRDGSLRRLDCGGTVVGLFPEMSYEEATVQLARGDIFVAFSDGIIEPENEFGEFGEERLIELIQQHRDEPLPRISEIVTASVQDWTGGAEQPDDITLVLARVQ